MRSRRTLPYACHMFGINAAEAAVLVLTVAVVVGFGVALVRSARRR